VALVALLQYRRIVRDSFAEGDVQLKAPYASLPPCTLGAYGLATISRLLQIIGLFCKRALSKRLHSAKETNDFKEPTHCSHPIFVAAIPSPYQSITTQTSTHIYALHPQTCRINYRSLLQKSPIKETTFCRFASANYHRYQLIESHLYFNSTHRISSGFELAKSHPNLVSYYLLPFS